MLSDKSHRRKGRYEHSGRLYSSTKSNDSERGARKGRPFFHVLPLPILAKHMRSIAEPPGRICAIPLRADRPLTAKGNVLTIISANLWHDWPRFRHLAKRLELFAQLVEAECADILLLQEVARLKHLRADQWLAERLGMASVYCRANGHEHGIGFEEGVAVLSRFQLLSPKIRHLGNGTRSVPFVRRIALSATVDTAWGSLVVCSVHLGLLPRSNMRQTRELLFWLGEIASGRSAVIGGDFNAAENSPQILRARATWIDTFRHLNPHAEGSTHEVRLPWGTSLRKRRLDYIFLHHGRECRWGVLESGHIHGGKGLISDHKTVMVRLGYMRSGGSRQVVL